MLFCRVFVVRVHAQDSARRVGTFPMEALSVVQMVDGSVQSSLVSSLHCS